MLKTIKVEIEVIAPITPEEVRMSLEEKRKRILQELAENHGLEVLSKIVKSINSELATTKTASVRYIKSGSMFTNGGYGCKGRDLGAIHWRYQEFVFDTLTKMYTQQGFKVDEHFLSNGDKYLDFSL